jgi:hypothetical protein
MTSKLMKPADVMSLRAHEKFRLVLLLVRAEIEQKRCLEQQQEQIHPGK